MRDSSVGFWHSDDTLHAQLVQSQIATQYPSPAQTTDAVCLPVRSFRPLLRIARRRCAKLPPPPLLLLLLLLPLLLGVTSAMADPAATGRRSLARSHAYRLTSETISANTITLHLNTHTKPDREHGSAWRPAAVETQPTTGGHRPCVARSANNRLSRELGRIIDRIATSWFQSHA